MLVMYMFGLYINYHQHHIKKAKRKNPEDVLSLLNAEDSRIHKLEEQIRLLEKDNAHLLNKIKDITTVSSKPPSTKSAASTVSIPHDMNGNNWLKQKIEKVEKNLDIKILKNSGLKFNSSKDNESCDWKDVLNVSFNIIQKLAKQVLFGLLCHPFCKMYTKSGFVCLFNYRYRFQIHLKEEQTQQLTNKWMVTKKENKELKKSKIAMEMTIERQKSMVKDNEQQIKEKDKKIALLKDNQRNMSDKMRKMEREMNMRFDEYDNKLKMFNDEKVRLHSKLTDAKKETKQSKNDYDEIMKQCGSLQEENDKLLNDVEKLRYLLSETNRKSIQLMECINNNKLMMNNLGYNTMTATATSIANADCCAPSQLSSDISLTMTYSKCRFPAGDTSQNYI